MKTLLLVLALLTFAVAAEAQDCLMCYTGTPFDPTPRCGPANPSDRCSGDCCGIEAYAGMPCSLPDMEDDCIWWLAAAARTDRPMIQRAVRRGNDPAFTSRLLLERQATRLQRRLSCPKS